MADLRTFYRKSNLTDIWHFCRECENWPLRYYEEIAESPVIGFCLSCIQKHRDEQCQSTHLEESPDWLKIGKTQAAFR
jgi:hypothetical protein